MPWMTFNNTDALLIIYQNEHQIMLEEYVMGSPFMKMMIYFCSR